MAKIAMFMLCDAISPEHSQMKLISPQFVLRPDFIPGNFSFGICAGISDIRPTTDTKMGFSIISPDDEIIYRLPDSNFERDAKEEDIPREAQGFMIAMEVRNIPVKLEGEYKFVLYINGEEEDRHGFYICKRSDQ